MSSLLGFKRVALRSKLTPAYLLPRSTKRAYDAAPPPGYEVHVSAEPLNKYQPGGYHPIHLGAQFKYGRYRVAHKLGWGGEGTVWLARDVRAQKLVALKVLIADEFGRNEESALLKQLFSGAGTPDHPGIDHLTQLLDSFWVSGPNGNHECLVLDIAGINAQDQAEKYPGQRLPAKAAWSIAKQITQALDRLHKLQVAHADLHTRNIMLTPKVDLYSNPDMLDDLPRPNTGVIRALPPHELTQHMPKYLVESTSLPYPSTDPDLWHAQLVDFGESFRKGDEPKMSRTPLVLRAPELLLSKKWDHRIDIWSLGCTIFELVTGKPPFDPENTSQNRLIQEWTDLLGDLPKGWSLPFGYKTQWGDDQEIGVAEWLKQFYFPKEGENANNASESDNFSKESIATLGDLLSQMFKYRPEERMEAQEILQHKWFVKSPFEK